MTAVAVVSSWVWSATILQSSNVTYKFGVSGAFWYAAGASIQLFIFSILAHKFKKHAPNAHTIGEVVYARWGPLAHKVFLYFFLLTNLVVLAMLIGGGSMVFERLTGLDRGTSSFFIRLTFYTGSGGLITGYISAYLHTTIVYVVMTFFVIYVFCFSEDLGSPSEIYDRLMAVQGQSDQECIDFGYDPELQTCGGITGNLDGSYLTLQSAHGLTFGIINIVGNFGAVFMDQSYWQIAISARDDCVFPGFLLGGLLWFAVPFCMSNSLGLANVALQLPTNMDEANNGLVAVASALHLNGNFGGKILMIQLFMAICAAGSAELNAVSSMLIYDIYRMYIKPRAKSRDIKYYARLSVLGSGSMLGGLAVLVNSIGISLGWLYLCMGILIGSAVCPISCLVLWRKASSKAAVTAAVLGQVLAVSSWLTYTKAKFGVITLETTGDDMAMLLGNLVALLSSTFIMIPMSLYYDEVYDFSHLNDTLTRVITEKDARILEERATVASKIDIGEHKLTTVERDTIAISAMRSHEIEQSADWTARSSTLYEKVIVSSRSKKYLRVISLTLLIVIVWPLFCVPVGVFDKAYFTFWISITILWCLLATLIIVIVPLYECWTEIVRVAEGACALVSNYCGSNDAPDDSVAILDSDVSKSSGIRMTDMSDI